MYFEITAVYVGFTFYYGIKYKIISKKKYLSLDFI